MILNNNRKISLCIMLIIVLHGFFFEGQRAYCDWQIQYHTIGEGIPAYAAINESTDHSLVLRVDFSTEEYCIPIFWIQVKQKGIEFSKIDQVRFQFSEYRVYVFKAHAANVNFIQILMPNALNMSTFLNDLQSEDDVTLTLDINNNANHKVFILGGSCSVLSDAQGECESVFFGQQDFVFPNSSKRLLEKWEVENLPKNLLRIARNEIFARHGYVFNNSDLKRHFGQFEWYRPHSRKVSLSNIEQTNAEMILSIEKQRTDK